MIIAEPGGSVRSSELASWADPPDLRASTEFRPSEAPPDRPGEEPCIVQKEPVRKLDNCGTFRC